MLSPIKSTELFYVSNTEPDLFFDNQAKHFYFLTAGRWFRAASLEGPWFEASTDLPLNFKQIPSDHAKAEVLFSVPGTPEAEVAVLLSSVPRRAIVNIKDARVVVVYDGAPEFEEIGGATVTIYFATNTANSVLSLDGKYYCVYNGIWFVSEFPKGLWVVASTMPAPIDTIDPVNNSV